MAITDLGHLAAGGGRTANQSSITTGITADVAVGELVIVSVAVDNALARGDFSDFSVDTVFLGPYPLTKLHSSGPATAAQTGPGLSVWYWVATSAVAFATNLVVTFNNAATSDHSALVARHFSVSPLGAQATNAFRNYVDTAGPLPSIDVTTSNDMYLRIRCSGTRNVGTGASVSFLQTNGWTAWALGDSGPQASTPDWEMHARAESIIYTGTNNTSLPSAGSSSLNANVYLVFQEVWPTGTLAATEGSSDSTSLSGVQAFGIWAPTNSYILNQQAPLHTFMETGT